LPFALFLGLDRADRFGMGETTRNLLTLLTSLPFGFMFGFPGAVFAILVTEVLVVTIGLVWTRQWIKFREAPTLKDMAPYASHQRIFVATGILMGAAQQGTGPLIKTLGGSFGDVAYFAAGNTLFMMTSGVLWQLALSMAPLMSRLRSQDRGSEIAALID